ncbi:hypothetical protein GCM10010433_32710 [Streptomyces pulveraceus]|uniref:Uncharacterized protein n=1 Tax=Streptomyces pulveraceus TaxID=68258 RepID=A0ABW1GSN2_9ACTN
MTRARELYYCDCSNDFGLSGFAGTVCSRATFRTDAQVVLAVAGAAVADGDDRLGRDVRPLLDSPLPDEMLRTPWGVRDVDAGLGFHLLLESLFAYDVPATDARRARYQALAERFGHGADHLDGQPLHRRDGVPASAQQ